MAHVWLGNYALPGAEPSDEDDPSAVRVAAGAFTLEEAKARTLDAMYRELAEIYVRCKLVPEGHQTPDATIESWVEWLHSKAAVTIELQAEDQIRLSVVADPLSVLEEEEEAAVHLLRISI